MLVTRDRGMVGRDGSWPGAGAKVRRRSRAMQVCQQGSNPTCWPLACLFVCWGVHSGLGKAGVG